MLAIGRALMSRPNLLLLDCPTLGLAPKLVNRVVKVIEELRNQGITILLIDQKFEHVTRIIDRGYVMKDGRVIFEGSPEELLSIKRDSIPYLGNENKSN